LVWQKSRPKRKSVMSVNVAINSYACFCQLIDDELYKYLKEHFFWKIVNSTG